MKTRLLIMPDNTSGYVDVDLYEDILIPLTFQVSDVKDLTKKNTNFSKSFEVPCTENNMQLFKTLDISSIAGNVKFGKKYPCRILQDGIDIISGVVQLEKINKENNTPISYTLQVNSEVKYFIDTINDKSFEDIDWSDLVIDSSDMSPANINNIWYGLDWDSQFDYGRGLALIDRINNIGNKVDYWRTKDLSPFIYANKILDKIITQAGYKWESMFFRHHFDGTWDDFNQWILGNSTQLANYPSREIRNVGKFDSRQFVIPSQVDPNSWDFNKLIPGNQIVDTYITRRNDVDDQKFVWNSLGTWAEPRWIEDTSSNTFFITDSATNTEYKLPKVKADGSIDETAGLQNYVFTATIPGWYELSFDFDWRYEMTGFRQVAYDRNHPIWNGTTYMTAGQKIVLENSSQTFYEVEFNAQVCEPDDTIRKTYKLYSISNNGDSVKWFKGDGSNKNRIPIELLRTNVNGISFNSMEYEEYNKNEGSTMVSVNGYEFGRPVNKKFVVYLYAGDKIRLLSRGTAISGYEEDGSAHLWEFNFRRANTTQHYVPEGGTMAISSRPDHKLFDAKLIDKIGPYRKFDPSLFYDTKTKQIDFVNSLVKMFNLYIEDVSYKKIHEDGNNIFPKNTLRIEPRPIYYNVGMYNWQSNVPQTKYAKKIVDFSDFIDYSTISYKRPDDYLYTNLVFKMKDDTSDYFSKIYKDKTLNPLGELDVKAVYSSTESDNNVDMIFANTTNGSSSCNSDPDFNVAIPCIFSLNDKGEINTGYVSEMRLLNKYIEIERTPEVYYDSHSYLSHSRAPILSVFDERPSRNTITDMYEFGYSRLEFGTREYYLEKFTEPDNPKISNTDLFNAFYLNEYSQITAEDARILSCKCYIPANVINDLKLSHNILIDGIIYYINKISNWVSENEPCDCEFLKYGPYSFYDEYIDNPTPSDFTLQLIGVSSSTDSTGNTTVNSNTTNYTIVNNYSSGTGDNYSISAINGDVTLYKNSQVDSTAQLPTFAGSGRGFVPQSTGDTDKYLCADGTWKTVNSGKEYTLDSTDGISVDLYEDNVLKDRVQIDTFLGADAQNIGTPGLVPTAQIADRTKFLRGDGTWQTVGSGGGSYEIENDPQNSMVINLKDNGVVTSYANIPEYEACSQQYAGEYGAVHPAPAGAMDWYFGGDAQWRPIPTEAYVLQFTKHSNLYTLDSGNYDGAITAINAGKPVFAILNDEDSSQDGDKIVYGDAHWYADDTTIILHSKPNDSTELYLELYDGDSFDFYSNTVRNFGRLSVNGSTYQSTAPNTTLTLNNGTGITLNRTNASVTFNLNTATNQEIGGIKVSSTVAPSAGSMATSGMRRPVQVDANGNASVLVDIAPSYSAGSGLSLFGTTFSLNQATDSTLGGIKVSATQASAIGSISTQGTVRPVQLDANGVAGVTIPDIISPLHLTNSGITCKAADIEESTYRLGREYLDYENKDYKDRAGSITPVNCVDTDKYGAKAIDAWHDLGTLFQPLKGEFFIPGPKTGSTFYALPIVTLRTTHGSVPVVLVNKRIYDQLDNYVVDENTSIVVQ